MGDVYQEVDGIMTGLRVNMHKIKPCSRRYAFELSDIPKEAEYLKLMYTYDSKYLTLWNEEHQLTGRYRTCPSKQYDWRNLFPYIWYYYRFIRAVCTLEKHHGPLLAHYQGG